MGPTPKFYTRRTVEIFREHPLKFSSPKILIWNSRFREFFANNSRTKQLDIVNRTSALKTANIPLGGMLSCIYWSTKKKLLTGRKLEYWATSSLLIVYQRRYSLSSFKYSWWAPKTHLFWNRVRNGPSRSSNVVDFGTNRKLICNFLLVINSNIDPILPRFRDIAGFLLKTAPHPDSTRILGVFPWTRSPMLGLREDRTLS